MGISESTRINGRALASFILILSFLLLPVSGVWLHKALGSGDFRSSHLPMAVHNASALIFMTAAILHWKLNRKTITAYARRYRREMALSFAAVSLVIVLAAAHTFLAG
jgi:hypothetical protein